MSIKHGESLSYAIDKQLDSELGTDVKLNLKEWNCIFEKIKNNQVTTNKNQFTDKDTDIRNGKHFVVDANSTYEIASDVWSYIVNIAKQRFGTKTAETVAKSATATTTGTDDTKDSKTTVLEALNKAKISTEGLDIDDIVKKYDTLKAIYPNKEEEELKQKAVEYATGKLYEKTLDKFDQSLKAYIDQEMAPEDKNLTYEELIEKYKAQLRSNTDGFTIQGVHEAMEYGAQNPTEEGQNKALKMQKEGYHSFARSLISTFDTDNDFLVNEKEFLAHMRERHSDAKETEVAIWKKTFEKIDSQGTKNGSIDENEMTAYSYALSKAQDSNMGTRTGDNISFLDSAYASNAMEYAANGPQNERQQNTVEHFDALMKLGYKNLN